MKTTRLITVECNGGEYVNEVLVTCENIEKVSINSIDADGIIIQFDEPIIGIY